MMAKGKVIDLFGDPHVFHDEGSSAKPYKDAPQAFYSTTAEMIDDFNRFFIQVLIGNQTSVIWEHDDDYTIFTYEQFNKQIWNDAEEFEKIEVDRHLWWKGW
jgi:hypothetical protein